MSLKHARNRKHYRAGASLKQEQIWVIGGPQQQQGWLQKAYEEHRDSHSFVVLLKIWGFILRWGEFSMALSSRVVQFKYQKSTLIYVWGGLEKGGVRSEAEMSSPNYITWKYSNKTNPKRVIRKKAPTDGLFLGKRDLTEKGKVVKLQSGRNTTQLTGERKRNSREEAVEARNAK